ncbi:MAG TPA: SprB repeat-containing protein, partial [Rheinheimera sp.]|nr:SprB repeat-containing protein [Rheinheimera sp.]
DGNALIFNSNHVQMTNGNAIIMHNSVTQGCIFIPRPGSNNLYYMFHIGKPSLGAPPFNLYYTEIDMNLSGGLGSVTANKNISIAASFNNCSEKMAATQHCNGTDYWVLVHDRTGNAFKAYQVSAAGINTTPVVSNVGTLFLAATPFDDIGQMKISPNGTKVALVLSGQTQVEIFDFNSNTGVVSNPISLGGTGSQNSYGLEFSPDNSVLYVSGTGTPMGVKQWNLCAGDAAAMAASGTMIAGNGMYSLQLAPNQKIYGAAFSTNLAVVNNPNIVGAGCNFSTTGINTAPGSNNLGLPGFVSSWFDDTTYSQVTQSQVNAACGCTGSATADLCYSFGVSPFTYSWSNGTTTGPTTNLTSTITNLCAGNYTLVISDASCRTDTLLYNISGGGPGGITIGTASVNPSCNQGNGSASVTATGGTPAYTYQWSSGHSTSAVTGLTSGT